MKKIIPSVLLLVILAAAAFVFLKKATVHRSRAAELAPAETVFFAQFPDLRRSAERWPKTALAQIWQEKEVQDFLAKPRMAATQFKLWEDKLEQIVRIEPREAFVAVTSIEGTQPRFLAGFSFSGRKKDVEAMLAEPRADLKRAWPAGKSDIATHGGTEIETFTYQDTTIGEAFRDDWYFISNDLELLRRTLDATASGLGSKALAANEVFKKSTARLPAGGDAVLFAQLGTLTERVVSLLVASGQPLDPQQVADLKKMQAVAWGTKFEDSQVRDTLFLLSPGQAKESSLARSTLVFSGPDTLLTYATALPATFEMPAPSLALTAFIPGFAAMEKGLTDKGLKWSDFGKAFGPEFGSIVDWAQNAAQPSALLALDVRDPATAKGFADVFTGGLAGSPAWGRKEEGGTTIYQSPAAAGLFTVSPSMALTDHFLVVGFSPDAVTTALGQLKTGKAVIEESPIFDQASKAVGTPTSGFGYLDLKALFERSYGTLRPFIAMSLAFTPDGAKYLDASKLPTTEAISKHLSPSVYSQSVTADGTLVESVGALTFNQVLVGAVGGAVVAAFPMIENALAGGIKLDPSTFMPSPAAPAVPSVTTPAPVDPAGATPQPSQSGAQSPSPPSHQL
jgi:hypothetical protein